MNLSSQRSVKRGLRSPGFVFTLRRSMEWMIVAWGITMEGFRGVIFGSGHCHKGGYLYKSMYF
jgi:hypothetical protein